MLRKQGTIHLVNSLILPEDEITLDPIKKLRVSRSHRSSGRTGVNRTALACCL